MAKEATFRNVRKTDFTQIGNSMLWDKELSLQAKGLLSIFLSNSNDWDLNMKEIIKRSKNGRDAHYKVVNELISHGYFARVEFKTLNKNGKEVFLRMEYLFSDNKSDIENELENIKIHAAKENNRVSIEYKDQSDKKKKEPKSKEDKVPHTENQETEKLPHTENQETENPYAENQYINNTNPNNTKLNNTKLKKEEEINNARARSIHYYSLHDFLIKSGIDNETANQTIKELIDRNIETFFMQDVKAQFEHMMDKLTYGEIGNHNNFPVYFVNGLEMRTSQSGANKKHQEKKLQEYEAAMQQKNERDTSFYFDWLNADQ